MMLATVWCKVFAVLVVILHLNTIDAEGDTDRRKSYIFLKARREAMASKAFSPVKKAEKPSPVQDANLQVLLLTKKVLRLEIRLEELIKKVADAPKPQTCLQGPPGRDGLNGRDGLPGPPGRDGAPGRDGRDAVGNSKPSSIGAIVRGISRVRRGKFDSGELLPNNVTYIRWGQRGCPQGQDVSALLSGRVTISYTMDTDSTPKYKCLSSDNALESTKSTSSFVSKQIYGVEYRLDKYNPFKSKDLNGEDVACAVCNAQRRETVTVFPNLKSCPENWRFEYGGYYMSENWNHIQTEHICVDINAQKSKNKPYDEHTATISLVESFCNGKPCGSDMDERAIRCIVCSKGVGNEP